MNKRTFVLGIINLCFTAFAIFHYNIQNSRSGQLKSMRQEYKHRFKSFDTLQLKRLMTSLKEMKGLIDASKRFGNDSLTVFLYKQSEIGQKYFDLRNSMEDEIENIERDIHETEDASNLLFVVSVSVFLLNVLAMFIFINKSDPSK